MNYSDDVIELDVADNKRKALLRTPIKKCLHPALLINLGGECRSAFEGGSCVVSDIFVAAGHRVVSLDLPNHGDRTDAHGNGLTGWANAIAAGLDVVEDVRSTVGALIDLLIKKGLAHEGMIFSHGTSRGAIMALHVFAADKRVLAASIVAPVIYLPALSEFHELVDNPIVKRANAHVLLPQLANRALFIAIGSSDKRVKAEFCFDFYAKLRALSTTNAPSLFTGPGDSHDSSPSRFISESGYQAAAGFLLTQCAEQLKMFGHISQHDLGSMEYQLTQPL